MTEPSSSTNDPSMGDNHEVQAESSLNFELVQNEVCTPEEAMEIVGVGLFQVKLIILSGFVWMARAFEFVIYRFIGGFQSCDWGLSQWQGTLMMTITSGFILIGSFTYGIWSDNYGRRTALSSSLIFLFVFGAVSAGLPSYTWFVIFRAIVGFAVGGLAQALVLCCEYMPSKQRGRGIYILSCFWALGVVLILSVLHGTFQSAGKWRMFIAIGAIPAFMAMVMMRFFPESYRFLMVSNQYIAANEIVVEMAENNKRTLNRPLRPLKGQRRRGRLTDIKGFNLIPLFLFLLMGLATAISYMGLYNTTPVVQSEKKECDFDKTHFSSLNEASHKIACPDDMDIISTFVGLVQVHAMDFPGFFVYILLIDVIDRKLLLGVSYLLSTLFTFLLLIPVKNSMMHSAFLHCARTLLLSQFDLLLLMATEIFPTTHRGTVVGLISASFHLGSFTSYYITEALSKVGCKYKFVLIGVLTCLSALSSIFVKPETRGKELTDVFEEE